MSVGMLGREVVAVIGGQTIAAKQSGSITVDNEPVDVTADNSSGWREVMDEAGQKSVEIPISGIVRDLGLLQSALATGSQKYACTLTYPDGSVVSGNFFLSNYTQQGEYNGAYTFDVTLMNDGAITFA